MGSFSDVVRRDLGDRDRMRLLLPAVFGRRGSDFVETTRALHFGQGDMSFLVVMGVGGG